MKNKPKAIYQDQRIAEEWCNFKCEYCEGFCPTEYSLKQDKDGNLHVTDEWYDMVNSFDNNLKKYFAHGRGFKQFYELADSIMSLSMKVMDTDILKISGGELTVNPRLCDFVESIHNNYPSIQILSNGSNIKDEDIERYKNMGNISFQISLDGVSPEANYSKSHSSYMTNKVVSTIDKLLENGIEVEINCVLTKYNTDKFYEFLEHFSNARNLMIFPRPIRGGARKLIDFNSEHVEKFSKCIDENYDKYKNILPSKEYFDRLIDIMKNNKRNYKCYVPFFVQSIDGYGNFEMCPIGLQYDNKPNIVIGDVSGNSILCNSSYDVEKKYSLCEYCINQYEMLNLYVDGIISLDELRRVPSLNNDTVLLHINDIKREICRNEVKRSNNKKVLSKS